MIRERRLMDAIDTPEERRLSAPGEPHNDQRLAFVNIEGRVGDADGASRFGEYLLFGVSPFDHRPSAFGVATEDLVESLNPYLCISMFLHVRYLREFQADYSLQYEKNRPKTRAFFEAV